jgi:hypothetical protein
MPDAPTTNTQDLANTEYDAQRRARAAAEHHPTSPDVPAGATQTPSDPASKAGPSDPEGTQHG